jgi:uncharacterized membrane protein
MINKKETLALGIFFISLFLIGFLIFSVISKQIIIQVNETKEVVISQPFSILHVLSIMILTILATICFSYYFREVIQKFKSSKKEKLVLKCLDKNERKVYEFLLKNGSAIQQEIASELGFSKVKISRIIDKLAEKELVKKYRQGYSNKIKIQNHNL